MRQITRVNATEVKRGIENGEPIVFLDARIPDAWDAADRKIRGAIRIPPAEVENHLRLVPQGRPIVTYCDSHEETSAARAAAALAGNGWKDVHPLEGGFAAAERAGLDTEAR